MNSLPVGAQVNQGKIIYFTQTHFVWSKESNRPREVIILYYLIDINQRGLM